MGRPKLLLPWGNTTIIGHLIAQWSGPGANQIAVVRSAANPALDAELLRLHFPVENHITNPRPEDGMFSSIQCAARWSGWRDGLTHWAIVLGDQPHLQSATLQSLVESASTWHDQILQPEYYGHARHPVILPASIFRQLAHSSHDTLKAFLQTAPQTVIRIELNDPGLDLDLDTPEDYERAQKLYFGL